MKPGASRQAIDSITGGNHRVASPQNPFVANLLHGDSCGIYGSVKSVNYNAAKREEAHNRMAAVRQARRSSRTAAALQQRASLVGDGAKWRITNFKQVARAMSQWA